MADYSFGGTDEENAELKKLNAEVVCLMLLPSLMCFMICSAFYDSAPNLTI